MGPIALDGNPIWHLDWLTLDPYNPDPNGVTWILEDEVGFWDGATPRLTSDTSALVEKVNKHGAMLGPNWMMERIITLKGKTFAPDQGTLSLAVTQLSSICSDPNQTYKLSCDSVLGQIYCNVRLDAQTQITPFALAPSFAWSIQLIAPDPRKYTTQTYTSTLQLPQASTGNGLDFATPVNNISNPQFATNTTGWSAFASTTLAQVTAPGTVPISGVTTAASATSTAAASNGMQTALQPLNLENDHVSLSAYLYATVAKTVTISISWYDVNSNLISQSTQATSLMASTWTQATVTGVPPTNATQYQVAAQETATASGSVFYATAFQAEYNAVSTAYTTSLQGLNFGANDLTGVTGQPVGLTFGASDSSGIVTLLNGGTAPALPVFTLNGPLNTPVLTTTDANDNTATMQYNGTLGIGDVVVIDPNAPSVLFNGASRRFLLNPANFSAFAIPPMNPATGQPGVMNVGLSHSGSSSSGGYATATYQWALF